MSALIVDAHRKSADADGVHRSEFIVLAAPTSEKPRRTVLSKVDLRGCEYDSLSAYIDPLLTAQQEFDRRPFVHLERVLRRSGNEELADDVYFRRRVIDGDRIPPTSGRYYFDRFVRLTTGYGVRPQQIIATILLTLLLGTVAFHAPGAARPKTAPTAVSGGTTTTSPRMTEAEVEAAYCAKPTPQLDWQGALWLTIQTMSPFEIPPQGGWVPAACPIGTSGMRNYYTAAMLKIVGFIFVSLAAATFTGFLRYLGSRS
jgi:hypothetical protein